MSVQEISLYLAVLIGVQPVLKVPSLDKKKHKIKQEVPVDTIHVELSDILYIFIRSSHQRKAT